MKYYVVFLVLAAIPLASAETVFREPYSRTSTDAFLVNYPYWAEVNETSALYVTTVSGAVYAEIELFENNGALVDETGMVLHYPFTEEYTNSTSIRDRGPYGLDVTQVYGSPVFHANDASMHFDGTSDGLRTAFDSRFNTTSLTWSFWVRHQNPSSADVVVARYDYRMGLIYRTTEASPDVQFSNGTATLRCRWYDSCNNTQNSLSGNNAWHHVVVSFDDAEKTYTVFVDGVARSNNTYGGTLWQNLDDLYVWGTGGYFFSPAGRFSNFRVYNRSVSQTEVDQLFAEGRRYDQSAGLVNMTSVSGGSLFRAYFTSSDVEDVNYTVHYRASDGSTIASLSDTFRFRVPFTVEFQFYKSNNATGGDLEPYDEEFDYALLRYLPEGAYSYTLDGGGFSVNFLNSIGRLFPYYKDVGGSRADVRVTDEVYLHARVSNGVAEVKMYEPADYALSTVSTKVYGGLTPMYEFGRPVANPQVVFRLANAGTLAVSEAGDTSYSVFISPWDVYKRQLYVSVLKIVAVLLVWGLSAVLLAFLITGWLPTDIRPQAFATVLGVVALATSPIIVVGVRSLW